MTYSLHYVFPWQRNRFDEAWIELALPHDKFWIEIPYGFTRNPSDPLAESEADRGSRHFPHR